MFPRLFKVYYSNHFTAAKKLKKVSFEGSDGTEEEKEDQPGKESVSDNMTDSLEDEEGLLTTTAFGALWRNKKVIKIFDCFMFQMMHRSASQSTSNPMYNYYEDPQATTNIHPKPSPSGKPRQYFNAVRNNLRSQGQLQATFRRMAEFVSRERQALVDHAGDIHQASLCVESQLFGYGLGIKEVAVVNASLTKPKVHRFFRLFAQLKDNSLLEILMISPENMNTICKSNS